MTTQAISGGEAKAPPKAPPKASPKAPGGSLTLKSAAALAIAYAAARFGAQLPDGAAQEIASALIDLVFALGLLGVGVGRTRAQGPIA